MTKMRDTDSIIWPFDVSAFEILDSMPDAVFATDRQMRIGYFNQVASELTGFRRREAVGMYCKDVMKSDICQTECLIRKALDAHQNIYNVDTHITSATEEKIDILINASLVTDSSGEVVGYLCVFRDIMDLRQMMSDLKDSRNKLAESKERLEREMAARMRTVNALVESEAQKQAILDASVDMIMQVDREMKIVWANKYAASVVNKAPEDLIGHTCHKYFQDADSPCPGCPCEKALETGNIEHGIMYQPAMDTVGESYWEDFGVPLKDESGKVVGVIEIARQVTDKVKAEQVLRKAKKDWEDTFDAITDMVMLLDNDHRILRANRAAANLLATTKENLIGQKCYEVVHKQRRPIDGCPLMRTDKTSRPRTVDVVMPDLGKTFICSAFPVWDDEPNLTGHTLTLKDVTEQRHLENRLQQARKLKAIGTLAGGIAHNFNNLLMGILGHVSLISLEPDTSDAIRERLNHVQKLVERGSELTSQLLGYAREGKYSVRTVNLNDLVKQICDTFAATHKQIGVHLELAEDVLPIRADTAQIEQVLLNLLMNAADAMPEPGNITVKTINMTAEGMAEKPYHPKPGNYVLLSVTDTGIGMDKTTQGRIFEPFFTTKEMGRGSGLGLASAYGIVKGHGGYIDVTSEKGSGTTFEIYLPALGKVVPEVREPAAKVTESPKTVLLVDDEEIIQKVGRELLKAMGYRVLIAKTGEEAVELYRDNQDDIDIVLLDMIMSPSNGGKTYDRLKEINPGIKVLLSSGYSIEGRAAEILRRGCNGFIQKPFRMKELSQKITAILHEE